MPQPPMTATFATSCMQAHRSPRVSLAIAEQRGLGGDAVLRAMVLGYEAAGRISAAMPRFRERGFHGCHGAIFAATVASSILLEPDAHRLAQAIALSATSIGGLVVAADTSVAREYHAGLATLLGVNAALAASRGDIRGPALRPAH